MAVKWLTVFSLIVLSVYSEEDTNLEIKTTTTDAPSMIFNDTSARQRNNAYHSGLHSSTLNFPSDDNDLQTQSLNSQLQNDQTRNYRRRRKPKRRNSIRGSDPYGQYYPQGPYNQSLSFQGNLNANNIYNIQKRPEFENTGSNGPLQFQSGPGFYGVPQGAYQFNPQYSPGFARPYAGAVKQDTLSSISDALGSIAKYDDFQCVPRLLCEMASSRSPVATQGSIISNLLNLEPLFTLLTAYNGASLSPIFSFGRAALLGMTSKGNSASCRYAYPRCPQDPDKLVDYLNNHNGGFFRFFNGGQNQASNQQYELSQFYDNLAGIQNNNINQNYAVNQVSNLGHYGYPGQNPSEQHFGGYGLNSNKITFAQRNKGRDFIGRDKLLNSEQIQARIQNNPVVQIGDIYNEGHNYVSTVELSQWSFPDNPIGTSIRNYEIGNPKKDRRLKFPPDASHNYNYLSGLGSLYEANDHKNDRKQKTLSFPNDKKQYKTVNDYQKPLIAYDYSKDIFPIRTGTGNFKLDLTENSDPGSISPVSYTRPYIHKLSYPNHGTRTRNDGDDLVYIVRGNGDPNNPEIVRINSGQKIH